MRLWVPTAVVALLVAVPHVGGTLITDNPGALSGSTFDYIVVGGGTAGLVVAARLAQNPSLQILVIEAGPDATTNPNVVDPELEINAVIAFGAFNPTVPQAVGNMSQLIITGKLLGGGSSINGMQLSKGTVGQYNDWGTLGNTGWNFNNMQSCMKKAEMWNPPTASQTANGAYFSPPAHGCTGPVDTGFPFPGEGYISYEDFMTSAQAVYPSLPRNRDLGSGDPRGADRFAFTITPANVDPSGRNTRSSSSSSYIYSPLSAHPNLSILVNTTAIKLTWASGSSNTSTALAQATGVMTTPTSSGNETAMNTFTVRKEIIISSGTLNSPALLERSGVGDPSVLGPLSIPVQITLPAVGTNLQDQAYTQHQYQAVPGLNSSVNGTDNQPGYGSVAFLSVQDLLGSAASAFLSNLNSTLAARANTQVAAGAFTSVSGLKQILQLQLAEMQAGAPVVELSFNAGGVPGIFTNLAWGLTPQSRGNSHITSTSPFVPPAINPAYLTIDADKTLEGASAAASRAIFNKPPLSTLWNVETQPGTTTVPANATQAQWISWAESTYSSVLHPVGTLPMLPRASGGAVSAQLKLYGTRNVRVVDASVIPTELSAHLQMTVYGIAEMAAMMIATGGGAGSCVSSTTPPCNFTSSM